MQSTHLPNDVLARTEVQVVGIAEDDLRPGTTHVVCAQTTNHRVSAYRHKCRCFDLAMGQRQHSGARGSLRTLQLEREHQIGRVILPN